MKNQILWFWVIVFTLFRGLRWEIGTDWGQFYDVYQHAEWNNIFSFARDAQGEKLMDYGYMFINTIFHEFGLPYTVFLLVTNFWIMWCFKGFSERYTKYPILSFVLIMNVGVPFPVRQTIAMATSLWSFNFAVEKKWVQYVVISIIASLIHKGSLIGFVVPFIFFVVEKIRIKWQWYAIAYASTFVIASFLKTYISDVITWLASSDDQLSVYSNSYMQLGNTSVDFGKYNVSLFNGLSYTIFFGLLLWIREKYMLLCHTKIVHFEFFFFMYAIAAIIDNLGRQGDSTGMSEMLGRLIRTIDMFPLIFPLFFSVVLLGFLKDKNVVAYLFWIYMLYKFWQQIPGSFWHSLYIPYKSVLGL